MSTRPMLRVLVGLSAVAVLASAFICAGAGAARAASSLEAVWSFGHGRVAVVEDPDGTFTGTVVAPTLFTECLHPVGQQMWTDLTPQPDGEYFGLHQWYFPPPECAPNPTLGPTAFRVLPAPGGGEMLRVCFSEPGAGQPTISPEGIGAGTVDPPGQATCDDSAYLAPVPHLDDGQFGRYVTLPGAGSCLAHTSIKVRVRDPKDDPYAKTVLLLNSGTVHRRPKIVRRGANLVATFNLRHLHKPTFKIQVRLATILGDHLAGRRSYRICAKRFGHHVKTHHHHHPVV